NWLSMELDHSSSVFAGCFFKGNRGYIPAGRAYGLRLSLFLRCEFPGNSEKVAVLHHICRRRNCRDIFFCYRAFEGPDWKYRNSHIGMAVFPDGTARHCNLPAFVGLPGRIESRLRFSTLEQTVGVPGCRLVTGAYRARGARMVSAKATTCHFLFDT